MANQFLTFGLGGGANVQSQADYAADPDRSAGNQTGTARSNFANKTWRQSAVIASQLAQFIADQLGEDVLDDGNTAVLLDQLTRAIAQGAGAHASRVVTASTPLAFLRTDYAVALNRSAGLTVVAVSLPADAAVGQEFVLEDISGNLAAYPATVTPPAGTIRGAANWVMNEDFQSAKFRRYAGNLWSVAS